MKIRHLLAVSWLFFCGFASAQSSVSYECSYYYEFYTIDYIRANHPECVSGTSGNTSQDVIAGSIVYQTQAVSHIISNRFQTPGKPDGLVSLGMTGLSAGAASSKWSVWGNVNLNNQRYTAYGPRTSTSESETANLVLGADYMITPKFVLGVSLARDDTGAKSYPTPTQVAWGITLPLNIETTGFNIAPYLGWQITPEWTLDASAGFGKGHYRDDIATAKSDRRFAAVNVAYTRWLGNWQALGKAGYLHSTDKYGNTAVNAVGVVPGSGYRNRLDQMRLSGQVGYWMNGVMPYAGLAYSHDIKRSAQANTPWDKSAFIMTLGVDFSSIKNGVTGGFAFNRELGRSNSRNYNFIGTINIRF
ncbi:MAG: hypothetical protein H6R18_2319 [Proteobacteria bacterium]|nr:hypothetical protein [Pseudomonadota bacterium]